MPQRSRRRTPWIIAGLTAFILADLALVAFAVSGSGREQGSVSAVEPTFTLTPVPSASSTPTPSATAGTPTNTPTATPAPTPSASASPSASPSAPTSAATLMGMADSQVGYRATAGTCTGDDTSLDSVIELTTDGGATWTNINPTDLRIRAVEKLVVVDASHVDLLARYGDACTESAVTTYTEGEFWQAYPDRTAALK
ncbi:hypothetical protein [Subtercola boreus]|uniref:hypothetical protein n=1 Tax=Subtercola boreus TaxID=120213 RepID=UPI00114FF0BF|nr:hypothetical protein [Subtercola boreus]TQL53253.1 hypothetical protein FB464_0751 [Subtercola boreus]